MGHYPCSALRWRKATNRDGNGSLKFQRALNLKPLSHERFSKPRKLKPNSLSVDSLPVSTVGLLAFFKTIFAFQHKSMIATQPSKPTSKDHNILSLFFF